ncbi:hypothetical protein JHK85_005150 [Glycine max]|nr:hypothetical protein JHK85_005150 [Glycine max]
MEKQWQLSFKHTLREGHQCADWFTKHGASNDASLVVLDSCPTTISSLLLADAMHFVRELAAGAIFTYCLVKFGSTMQPQPRNEDPSRSSSMKRENNRETCKRAEARKHATGGYTSAIDAAKLGPHLATLHSPIGPSTASPKASSHHTPVTVRHPISQNDTDSSRGVVCVCMECV